MKHAALLIDETYNASPVALRAALEVLAETPVGKGGRRIAVLGDMLELGDTAVAQHIAMAADVERRKIDLVFAVGPLMNRLYGQLPTARRGGAANTCHANRIAAANTSMWRTTTLAAALVVIVSPIVVAPATTTIVVG